MDLKALKQEYREDINRLKSGLIDKQANFNNKIGLIGSDASRLHAIKELVKQYKGDLIFYTKINSKN